MPILWAITTLLTVKSTLETVHTLCQVGLITSSGGNPRIEAAVIDYLGLPQWTGPSRRLPK